MPYLSFLALSTTSPGLDCHPLSLSTLYLLASYIPPSPSFGFSPPDPSHLSSSFALPSTVCIVSIVVPLTHSPDSSPSLNPLADPGQSSLPSNYFDLPALTLRILTLILKRITWFLRIPFRTTQRHPAMENPRNRSVSKLPARTCPFASVKV